MFRRKWWIVAVIGLLVCASGGLAADQKTVPLAKEFSKPVAAFVVSPISHFGSEWLEKCSCGIWMIHCGADLDIGKVGEEVKAAGDGVVRYAGSFGAGWGSCVIVEHNTDKYGLITSLYGHIRIASGIKPGLVVGRGTLLGTIDPNVNPPHCHFGIRLAPCNIDLAMKGALYNCSNPKHVPKFPEKFTDPVAFLAEFSQAESGNDEEGSNGPTAKSADEDWHSMPFAVAGAAVDEFFGGTGRAVAFISNRDGLPAIYAKDMKQNDCYKIASLTGMKEQFVISPGGNILLFGNDGKLWMLLVDKSKASDQSFRRPYCKAIKVSLDVKPDFFPGWANDDEFYCLTSGEIRKVSFDVEQVSPLGKVGNVIGGDLKNLADRVIGKKAKVQCTTRSIGDETEFVTSQKDDRGCLRVCVVDRFGKVKQWLTPSGLSAGEPQVGQSGMLTPVGSGIGPVVFTAEKNGQQNVYRLDGAGTDKSKIVKLTTNGGFSPCWAYSTQKIYFTSKRSGGRRIYEMNADGKQQKELNLK